MSRSAIAQEQIAVGVEVANVARCDKAVALNGCALLGLIVIGEIWQLGKAR